MVFRYSSVIMVLLAFLVGCGSYDMTPSQNAKGQFFSIHEFLSFGKEPVQKTTRSYFTHTKYPIVLAHGLLGNDDLLSLRRVAKALSVHGYTVYLSEVCAANTISYRASHLADEIDYILEESGSEKVNIIGHSMGGLDARYLISSLGYEDRVASLTTVATPHRGSPIADACLQNTKICNRKIVEAMINMFSVVINESTNLNNADIFAAVSDLTVGYLKNIFNKENLDSDGVYYQSWAGIASPKGNPAKVHYMLNKTSEIISSAEGDNDGLVSVESAMWGDFRGSLPADHYSQIGLGRPLIIISGGYELGEFYPHVADELARKGF